MAIYARSDIRVTSHQIPEWHRIPNTSIQLKPLMIYHGAFEATAEELRTQLDEVGEVIPATTPPQWLHTVYSEDHFHSAMHTVLGVVSGRSRACFGGKENPDRFESTVQRGDLIIIPAGVSHLMSLDGISDEQFEVVLAYPRLQRFDLCFGQPGDEEKVKNIQNVAWFHRDPLYGDDGPALHV